jgi:hypothetical protein
MEEEENWQTLFINVSLEDRIDWACFNIISDEFFDNMFNLFPQSAEKINIDLA